MRQDDRAPFELALRPAREAAFGPGEFAGQESFMTASEIRALAARAGIGPGVSVLDLGCGVGGPAALLDGCEYLGVDFSPSAIEIARARAPARRFAVAHAPPLPPGRFDVVLLLEAMLAIEDKDALVGAVASGLAPGGRFAFTLEEGRPLSAAERAAMPDADTVFLHELDALAGTMARAGLELTWHEDHSTAHAATARALAAAYEDDGDAIAGALGPRALDDLLAAHRLWVDWLETGRVRKLALVATRMASGANGTVR